MKLRSIKVKLNSISAGCKPKHSIYLKLKKAQPHLLGILARLKVNSNDIAGCKPKTPRNDCKIKKSKQIFLKIIKKSQ